MTTHMVAGYEAIELVERLGADAPAQLAKYADPTEGVRTGLTVDEARAIATEDSALIYIPIVVELGEIRREGDCYIAEGMLDGEGIYLEGRYAREADGESWEGVRVQSCAIDGSAPPRGWRIAEHIFEQLVAGGAA